MITLTGKKVAEGIVIGKLVFFQRDEKEVRRFAVEDAGKEIIRFHKARERALLELQDLCNTSEKKVSETHAMVFEVQHMVLEDGDFIKCVTSIIEDEKMNAEYAVKKGAEQFFATYGKQNTGYVCGHEADVKDITNRILQVLARVRRDRFYKDEPFIMAAKDLYPSEAVKLDQSNAIGFVTMYGSINSHTAVLARTKGIPSIIGLGEALKKDYDGKTVIIDGFEGKLYIEPDQTTMTQMLEKKKKNIKTVEALERLKGKENVTQSGQKIDVCANIGSKEDIESVLRNDANGIGLFRSEFIYMESNGKLPSEEQQLQVYKMATEIMGPKKVVIRTADIGGDKRLDYLGLPAEANPMMGYRGIRISLDKNELFKSQLRAILRASAYGNISIMLPMITSIEEVIEAKKILEKAKEELIFEKIPFNNDIKLGVMIETPAAVLISGELAREVDFFSIGTNDLTQYTLAMDRQNGRLSNHYNPYHPALLKMIRIVANNVHLEDKPISICGDLAADTTMTEWFIQMGIDELSVSPSNVLPLRKKIREIK